MILILGGTLDSRQLTEKLLTKGYPVCYSSLTDIASDQMRARPGLVKICGKLDVTTLGDSLISYKIAACVDVTHPYAGQISENAIQACQQANIPYLRLERPSHVDDEPDIIVCDHYQGVTDYLNKALKESDKNILLTTGSRQLQAFQGLPKERLYARVLPTSGVLKKCEDLGYKPRQILALQGPFSVVMNQIIMKEYKIGFMVTKDSGDIGGVREKIAAARLSGCKILFIRRPPIDYPNVVSRLDAVFAWLEGLT